MNIDGNTLLSYCTNVHPGESLAALEAHLVGDIRAVKAQVCHDSSFGLGLRIGAEAARALASPRALRRFREQLAAEDCFVFSINGFPYGRFHNAPVKEQVYQPDWSAAERLRYTNMLANILSVLLADAPTSYGSISTLPGGYRPRMDGAATQRAAHHIMHHVAHLFSLAERHGCEIVLALEAEPHCMLETTAEVVDFIRHQLWSKESLQTVGRLTGLSIPRAEEVVRRHVGVCLDACHAAVEYELPDETVRLLRRNEISVAKAQLSSAIRLAAVGEAEREALKRLDEPTYLHQVVVLDRGTLRRYRDICDALAAETNNGAEWRVHFHVPIYARSHVAADGFVFGTTRDYLERLLDVQAQGPLTLHLEVETYTWGVLSPALEGSPLSTRIAEEIDWARARLDRAPGLERELS